MACRNVVRGVWPASLPSELSWTGIGVLSVSQRGELLPRLASPTRLGCAGQFLSGAWAMDRAALDVRAYTR